MRTDPEDVVVLQNVAINAFRLYTPGGDFTLRVAFVPLNGTSGKRKRKEKIH